MKKEILRNSNEECQLFNEFFWTGDSVKFKKRSNKYTVIYPDLATNRQDFVHKRMAEYPCKMLR